MYPLFHIDFASGSAGGGDNPETPTMVSPDGTQEKLLAKLELLKRRGLTSRQRGIAVKNEEVFVAAFFKLFWGCSGLSKEDLREFSEDELRGLCKLLTQKVRKRRRWLFLNPFTWIAWLPVHVSYPHEYQMIHSSLHYFIQLKRLRKYYGEDYFPSNAIYVKLKKK